MGFSPSSPLATLRPDLADSFMEFDLEAANRGMIASKVFPIAEVAKQSGTFGKIPIESLLRESSTKRAPGAGYSRGNGEFEDASFSCEEHGFEEPVDEREAKMYADYFDAEQVAAKRALGHVMRNYEQRVANKLFDPSTFTGSSLNTSVTNEWDDHANATPISDVLAAKLKVFDNIGARANAVVLAYTVFENLRRCGEVIDAIASSGAGSPTKPKDITNQMLAEALGVDYLFVGDAVKNTADEGLTASLSQIWSNEYAMVCKVATSKDFREAAIGRTFHWAEDGSMPGGTVESYEEAQTRSNVIRVRHDVDEVLLYTEAGHLLDNITT